MFQALVSAEVLGSLTARWMATQIFAVRRQRLLLVSVTELSAPRGTAFAAIALSVAPLLPGLRIAAATIRRLN